MTNFFVTGAAGFIGFHLAKRLLARGDAVTGLDNINDYYSPKLKRDRLKELAKFESCTFFESDLADADAVATAFDVREPKVVFHLGAQAGVRYSIEHPQPYVAANLVGFANVLEACRQRPVEHLLYASSSSVYGANTHVPFATRDGVGHPLSLYAATKRSNELMAHSYSHLFRLPTTGLRFFTVYGPWGRPDMALFRFTDAIARGKPIDVYNRGRMQRDFTYVDDAIECIVRLAEKPPCPDPHWSSDAPRPDTSNAPFRIFNLGGNRPVWLDRVIELIEEHLGMKADKRMLPMQLGDVLGTASDASELAAYINYQPETSIDEGVARFVEWYRAYHG